MEIEEIENNQQSNQVLTFGLLNNFVSLQPQFTQPSSFFLQQTSTTGSNYNNFDQTNAFNNFANLAPIQYPNLQKQNQSQNQCFFNNSNQNPNQFLFGNPFQNQTDQTNIVKLDNESDDEEYVPEDDNDCEMYSESDEDSLEGCVAEEEEDGYKNFDLQDYLKHRNQL